MLYLTGGGTAAPFVTVKGMQFYRGDTPYYFAGTNMWYGCYLGAAPERQERLVQELDLLKALGITNLRILGASEDSAIERSVKPAIQPQPGEYDESLLKGLDFLLAEMGKRNMLAVIFLNNYWEWSGGMSQYVDWFTDEPIIDPGKSMNWSGFMAYSARFYTIDEAQKIFRAFLKHIVLRRNTITGGLYKDDPAIMAWELANEPRPAPDGQHNMIFLDWINGTAAYIKSMDENHLVSTGTEGLHGCLYDPNLFVKIHSGPNIDYACLHLWPKNWGWFKARRIEETLPPTLEKARDYINRHITLGKQIGKPLILGEFGMERDQGRLEPGTPTTARDQFLAMAFGMVNESAKQGGPFAGTNVWAWGGLARPNKESRWWQPGDTFTGDPPQEAQGLNSIFNIDTSTLEVLRDHSAVMQSLCIVNALRSTQHP